MHEGGLPFWYQISHATCIANIPVPFGNRCKIPNTEMLCYITKYYINIYHINYKNNSHFILIHAFFCKKLSSDFGPKSFLKVR